jgi:hypothetical protein
VILSCRTHHPSREPSGVGSSNRRTSVRVALDRGRRQVVCYYCVQNMCLRHLHTSMFPYSRFAASDARYCLPPRSQTNSEVSHFYLFRIFCLRLRYEVENGRELTRGGPAESRGYLKERCTSAMCTYYCIWFLRNAPLACVAPALFASLRRNSNRRPEGEIRTQFGNFAETLDCWLPYH